MPWFIIQKMDRTLSSLSDFKLQKAYLLVQSFIVFNDYVKLEQTTMTFIF